MMDDLKQNDGSDKGAQDLPSESKSLLQIILEWCCVLTLTGVIVLLAAQVIIRYGMGGALPWTGEMATWLFSWTTFIGATLVFMEKKHVVIDLFISFFPPKLVVFLGFFQQVLILALLIVLTIKGLEVTKLYLNQTATSLPISTSFLFISLPISSVIMIGWIVYGWVKRR